MALWYLPGTRPLGKLKQKGSGCFKAGLRYIETLFQTKDRTKQNNKRRPGNCSVRSGACVLSPVQPGPNPSPKVKDSRGGCTCQVHSAAQGSTCCLWVSVFEEREMERNRKNLCSYRDQTRQEPGLQESQRQHLHHVQEIKADQARWERPMPRVFLLLRDGQKRG